MGERERDDNGRFERNVSDNEVLAAVEKHAPAGTTEVADELGIARQSADYRLRQLQERGLVSSKKIGGTLAWMILE
ncbi:helix-turn-helix domain-containing protein [Salinarchaeum chitinilyticum]